MANEYTAGHAVVPVSPSLKGFQKNIGKSIGKALAPSMKTASFMAGRTFTDNALGTISKKLQSDAAKEMPKWGKVAGSGFAQNFARASTSGMQAGAKKTADTWSKGFNAQLGRGVGAGVRNASRIMDGLATRTERTLTTTSRLFKTAGKGIGGFIVSPVTAAGHLLRNFGVQLRDLPVIAGAAAVAIGVHFDAMVEQAQVAMTTLLHSGTRAQKMISDLEKFARQTPFDFPQLANLSQQLLGAGLAAKQVIPTLTAWGNAAAANGASQDQFARAMQQVIQAIGYGKVSMVDLRAISNNQIPVVRELAKAFGVTTSKIFDMSKAGQLTSDKVLPALQKQLQKDYGGSLIKQSQTLNGLWSNMKDVVQQLTGRAVKPFLPLIKSMMRGFVNLGSTAVPKIDRIAKKTADFLRVLRQAASGKLTITSTGIISPKAFSVALKLGNALQKIRDFARVAWAALTGKTAIADKGILSPKMFKRALDVGDAIRNGFGRAKKVLTDVANAAKQYDWKAFFDSWKGVGGSLKTLVANFGKLAKNALLSGAGGKGGLLTELGPTVRTTADALNTFLEFLNRHQTLLKWFVNIALTSMLVKFALLNNPLAKAAKNMWDFGQGAKAAAKSANRFRKGFKDAEFAASEGSGVAGTIGGKAGKQATRFHGAVRARSIERGLAGKSTSTIPAALDVIGGGAASAIGKGKAKAGDIAKRAKAVAKSGREIVRKASTEAKTGAKLYGQSALDTVTGTTAKAKVKTKDVTARVKDVAKAKRDIVRKAATSTKAAVTGKVASAVDAVSGTAAKGKVRAKDVASRAKEVAKTRAKVVQRSVTGGARRAGAAVTDRAGRAGAAVGRGAGRAGAAVGRGVSGAATGIASAGRAIADVGKKAGGAALGNVQKFGGLLRNAGKWAGDAARALGGMARQLLVSGLRAAGAVIKLVAYKIATTAISLATKIWAGIQAILNVVMSLNPIGIIIIAIVALVAAIVLAYKHSATFRRIVQALWDAIKKGASFVWNKVLKPFFAWFGKAVGVVVGFVKKHWKTLLAILVGPIGIAVRLVSKHWDTIKKIFWAVVHWVTSAFKKQWAALSYILHHPVDAAKKVISTVLDKVKGAFSSAVEGIKNIWHKLEKYAKDPIRFMVNTVFNGGLLRAFNWISDKIPGLPHVNPVRLPKGFREGGPIRGPGTGRSDSILARVSNGEYITPAKQTAKYRPVLEAIRADRLPGFKEGGAVDLAGRVGGVLAHSLVDPLGGFLSVFKAAEKPMRTSIHSNLSTGHGVLGEQAGATALHLMSVVEGAIKKADAFLGSLTGAGPLIAFARKFLGVRYVWGGSSPGGFDCSGLISYVLHHFGINPPRTSRAQYDWTKHISAGDAGPGDLVFFGHPVHHVGLDVGRGKMLDAPHTGAKVRIEDIWGGAMYGRIPGLAGKLIGLAKGISGFVGRGASHAAGHAWAFAHGIRGKTWNALDYVISHESSWNTHAQNPRSSAYGLGQLIRANWGRYGYGRSFSSQMRGTVAYMRDRYGGIIPAANYWRRHHYYAKGGSVGGPSGTDNVPAWLTAGEYVVHKGAAKMFRPILEWMNAQGYATGGGVTKPSASKPNRQRLSLVADIQSARKAGESLLVGLVSGLTGTSSQIKSKLDSVSRSIISHITGKRKNTLLDYVKATNRRLQDLAKQRDVIAGHVKAASQAIADATKAATDFLAISNIENVTSPQDLITGLATRLDALKTFTTNVAALQKKGLASGVIKQIVGMGPEAGAALAGTLTGASKSQIREINKLQGAVSTASKKFGRTAGAAEFGVKVGKSVVKEMGKQLSTLKKHMHSLAETFVKHIKSAFGVHRSDKSMLRAVKRDSGGPLLPGLSLVYNGTGRTEHVLTHQQLAAVAGSGVKTGNGARTLYGKLYLDSGEYLGSIRGVVQDEHERVAKQAALGRR